MGDNSRPLFEASHAAWFVIRYPSGWNVRDDCDGKCNGSAHSYGIRQGWLAIWHRLVNLWPMRSTIANLWNKLSLCHFWGSLSTHPTNSNQNRPNQITPANPAEPNNSADKSAPDVWRHWRTRSGHCLGRWHSSRISIYLRGGWNATRGIAQHGCLWFDLRV